MKKIIAFLVVCLYIAGTATVWGQSFVGPQDYTSKMTNPAFTDVTDDGKAGWSFVSKTGYTEKFTDVNGCAELWNCNYDFYQTLTDLPNGLYKVSVQGFYRDGVTATANKVRNAYLYANEVSVPLKSILDEASENLTGLSKVTITEGDKSVTYNCPNSIGEASSHFEKGLYGNELFVTVTDGTLKLGIRDEVTVSADWAAFDNFTLTYLGTITNPYTGTGKFYLQNVSTGEYLQGGGIDGLQAMLGNGIEFELVKKYDGIYHIRNVGINPEGNDYLSDERRLDDQPVDFIITETNEGSKEYNIATLSGFLLTAVAGNSNNGERYMDLNDSTLYEWNGVTPGSTIKQSWTYEPSYEGFLHDKYHSNQVYSKGALVYGTNDENGNVHPNLTGYTTMTIKGTSGSRLKVIFNCEGGANSGAPRKEEDITIGESGYYTIDLTPYGYFHLNAIKVPDVEGATATIESITLDKFDVVDANLGTVQFALWSQAAPGGTRTQLNPQNFSNNVGKPITASNLVYGDAGVWPLNYADLTGYKSIRIKATPEAKLRFLFNREGTNDGESSKGNFVEKIVTIESDGYGFLDLSEYSYVHLNAIKTANDSKEAYIEEIMLSRKNNSVMFLAGADKGNNRSQWRFVTEDQRIQELAGATRANPKNATFLIKNASLTEIDNDNNSESAEASPFWKSAEHWYYVQRDWTAHSDGAGGIVKSNKGSDEVYQSIPNLPNGLYELSIQGCYSNFDNAMFYANGIAVALDEAGSEFETCINADHSDCSCRKVLSAQTYGTNNYKKTLQVIVTNGTLRIGVRGAQMDANKNFLLFDNFRLTYLGQVPTDVAMPITAFEGSTFGPVYMKNVSEGTYLTAGGSDGVTAVLGDLMYQHSYYPETDEYKQGVRETDFTFVAVADGKWKIKTGFGDDGYLVREDEDGKARLNGAYDESKALFELRCIGGNYYIVHVSPDGTNRFLRHSSASGFGWGKTNAENQAPGDGFKWTLQTKDDLLAEFPSATESNPIDATFLLRGTAFHKDDSRNSAWTGKPVVGGAESNYVGSASGRTFDISQKLTGVPNGVYEFTLQGYYITEGDALNTDVKYYTSTDGRTLTTTNYNGVPAVVNGKNFTSDGQNSLVWSENFQSNMDGNFSYTNLFTTAGGSTVKNVQIGSRSINPNFGLPEYQVTYQTDGTTVKSKTEWQYHKNGLYAASSGTRAIGFSNLQAGQIVKLKVDDISAFSAADNLLEKDLIRSVDGEVVFRVIKSGNAGVNVTRYHHIYEVSVHNELTPSSVSISTPNDASTVFANAQGTHPVIRFKVENNTIIAGVYNTIKTDNASLYIDNVRLTYLGENVTDGIATPQKLIRGIHHKRSRYYDLAAENGHLEFINYNTVDEASNKTTLSNETMVKLNKNSNIMIQHAPVYRDTIYAKAGQKLEIVLPSSYSDKAQSSGKYYQRLYNYKTDDIFVEDAANVGVFDLGGSNQGTTYTDADIRKKMEVYEGSMSAPAGGWVFGNRWGQQLVSKFNFTTPTSTNKFSTLEHAIEIAVDYTDLTDVGDMGMFGDLTEPTLVQRAIFVIVPSQIMENKLATCTGDKFLEVKSISFPTIWHGLYHTDLNAVALDMQIRNYLSNMITEDEVELDKTEEVIVGKDTLKIVKWVDFLKNNIEISCDANGTGITLATTELTTKSDRFIKFKYPEGGKIDALNTAYIYVKTKISPQKNIAKFILDFVPDTELRPWKDIMGQDTLSRSPMYLDYHAELIDVLNFDKSYRKDGNVVTHPGTWPIGDATSINGIEGHTNLDHPSQFNPYPLNFDQTTFGAYYPRAIWSQYSVMKSMHSYRNFSEFKDVNQLYHDYFSTQEGTDDLLDKYQGGGYFMYIDASNFPSSIARLTMEEKLCAGTTIHFSGWVSSLDKTTNNDKYNSAGYLLFSIVGIEADGNETVIESFCPGPIRADAQPYVGEMVGAEGYHADMPNWDGSYSIWQQFAFSFVIKADVAGKYEEYALKIDNYCSSTSGGDMMVDDVRLYIHKAVPDVMQSVPVCSSGDMSGVEIYTDLDQLLSAVSMQEATSEADAYQGYVDKQGGGKIIPTAWYCFLDKKKYDDGIAALTSHNIEDYDAVFNSALVTTGGGTGYHSFTFSTHFESNNGGIRSFENSYTHTPGTSTQIVSYDAKAGTDGRIYFNPKDYDFEGSLRDFPFMVNDDLTKATGTWSVGTPEWNMNGAVQTANVYGSFQGEEVHYADLEGYDELRIYQTAGNPVRCFFFNNDNNVATNLTVTVSDTITDDRPMRFTQKKDESGVSYWSVDLNTVKKLTGQVKLISIKSATSNNDDVATVTAINVVRKSVELEPSKDYYIVFKAYQGETGVTSLGSPTTFFNMRSEDCAARDSFSLVSGTELRYDGELNSEGKTYCEGQIATVKMEIQAINTAAGVPVKEEDLFYDWWLGDINSFSTKADGKPDSPQGVLFDFREAYPDATVYDGQPAKVVTLADGGYECNFTESDRTYLEELVDTGTFLLYQSSLNMKITNSSGYQAVSVMPIVNLLEKLTGLPYCKGPIEVKIPVQGKSPSAKHGFQGTDYPMDEVPVRIGLSQLKSATDESADKWIHDNTSSLYIPLRNIKFSDESKYNSFGKKKHKWGTGSTNTLEIAAVYLAETNDPDMVSYGDDVDPAGNRELRYVGKMHNFKASKNNTERFKDYVQLTFNPDFTNNVKEGYRYTLKTSFEESGTTTSSDGTTTTTETNTGCAGDLLIPLYIVPEYQVWIGGVDGNWANDDNWRRADNEELKFAATTDRPTNEANTTSQGFVPMDFTKVLMKSDNVAVLKSVTKDGDLVKFDDTDGHTSEIQYHLAAAKRKGENIDYTWIPSVVRGTDIYCEPFYTNTAKEVHFEPHSQMLNTQYLTYERAWVEYALESGRWYTLSSPLQGVVSGDMYLPRGTAKQESPYFKNITYDNTNYTRLVPAVYQQAWDKAEATTYRLERDELVNKRPPQLESNTATVNVARAFDWSREYNDVKVPFGINGFSVQVDVSRIEDYSKEEGVKDVLLRLPKDDTKYDYYLYDDATSGSETADLKNLRENAGKLFTDGMPAAGMTVTLTNNSTDNPYFLVGNPFMSGLNLDKFFEKNAGLEKKYWILTKDSYSAGVKDESQNWISTDNGETADAVAPLQAFFVEKSDGKEGTLNVTFTSDMAVQLTGDALQTRAGGAPATLRLTAMRDGVESRAIVVCREEATEGFSAGEDVEALFDSNLSHAPTLYTAAGEVAAAINVRRTLHGVPVGIGGEDESEVTLTFDGVEQFGEELYLYDAAEGTSTLIPASGTSLSVCGRTTGRYYLVTTPLDGSAQESVPVVSVQGHVVTVLSAFDEILSVEAYDATGRKVYAESAVGNRTRFTLSAPGVYLITVKTAAGVFSHKVLVNS